MRLSESKDHIVFAGGGTAGHLFPGLAVADYLRRVAPQLRITFAGTGRPFELRHVRAAGFDYMALPCRPFPKSARETLRFLADHFAGYRSARRFMIDQQVALVVGLGGYASVPAARAAAALKRPYALLEQNAVPGRATRWLAGNAALVCSAFEEARPALKMARRLRVTGNPLRRELLDHPVPSHDLPDRADGPRRLLVLGGSGGAQTLNEQTPRALYKAGAAIAGWEIVHQTGERDRAPTEQLYAKLGLRAVVVPFIEALPRLLRGSHLAISRAGGTTLAELAASGLAAILLPYPAATNNHQRKNADVYTAAGAALTIDERDLAGRLDNHLAAAVSELASDHPLRVRMSSAMSDLAQPQATRRVARLLGTLLQSRHLAAV